MFISNIWKIKKWLKPPSSYWFHRWFQTWKIGQTGITKTSFTMGLDWMSMDTLRPEDLQDMSRARNAQLKAKKIKHQDKWRRIQQTCASSKISCTVEQHSNDPTSCRENLNKQVPRVFSFQQILPLLPKLTKLISWHFLSQPQTHSACDWELSIACHKLPASRLPLPTWPSENQNGQESHSSRK